MRGAVVVICALTRFDTCALVFASVSLPLYFHSGDFVFSLTSALPVLTICMCGFVINDLSDIEKDRENHPRRPLPRQAINELGASIIYFSLLAASLVAIKLYVASSAVYLYLLLLVALINYNYVVEYVPAIKTVYVATVGLIPIFILASLLGGETIIARIAPSLFLFLLGRELLMDVQDLRGDAKTFVKIIGISNGENFAFILKLLGSSALWLAATSVVDMLLVFFLVFLDLAFAYMWRLNLQRRTIIQLMKVQLLVGIYFLVKSA